MLGCILAPKGVWINAYSDCNGTVKLSLYNMNGQEVLSIFKGELNSSGQYFKVGGDTLQNGVYFVSFETECGTNSSKFIKL